MIQKIDLLIRTLSPLHVSSGEKGYYFDSDTGYIGTTKGDGKAAITRTYRLSFAKTAGLDGGKATGGSSLPVINSNGLRGLLRRFAVEELKELIIARGEFVNLDVYHTLTCGSPNGRPDGKLSVDQAKAAMSHPFIGLFGGTARLVRGSVSVGIGWPVHAAVLEAGLLSEKYREYEAVISPGSRLISDTNYLTAGDFFSRKDDALSWSDINASRFVADYTKSVDAWLAKVDENYAARAAAAEGKGAKGKKAAKQALEATEVAAAPEAAVGGETAAEGDTSTSRLAIQAFNVREYVLPNLHFVSEHRLDTSRIGNAGFGLYILALTRFANAGEFGGGGRNGTGRIEVKVNLPMADGRNVNLFTKSPNGTLEPDVSQPEIAAALDAWAQFAPTVTAASLTDICFLGA